MTTPIPDTLIDLPLRPADAASPRLRRGFGAPLRWLVARDANEVAPTLDAAHAESLAGRWCIGWVAYEAASAFDTAFVAGEHVHAPEGVLAAFAVFDESFDWPDPDDAPWTADDWHIAPGAIAPDDADFARIVDSIRAHIADGDVYQVNLTTRLDGTLAGDPAAYFRALHRSQPRGYAIHLPHAVDGAPACVSSVSPELFFHWKDGVVTTQPMKGTAPRGADDAADRAAAEALVATPKERAENLMIVDLLRNDLSRVALPGSVRVPRLFELHALPTVWQMTSTIRARTRPGLRLAELFAALFPCGSVTGAPKRAAMAAIRALEPAPRGVYCGAVGVLQPGGEITFNVAIRTVTLRADDPSRWQARCGIGSGITFDSRAAAEAREWRDKQAFLRRAARPVELLESLRLEDGRWWLLDEHLARLAQAAQHFGHPLDATRVRDALDATARTLPTGVHKARLRVTDRGAVRVDASPLAPTREPVRLVLASQPMPPADEFIHHKTTRREAYAPFAPTDSAFDTLLWNAAGELTETTIGNVALRIDGRWLTPPASAGLLPGTYRAALLAEGRIVEATLRVDDLARAEGVAFFNSVRGWLAATVSTA